MAQTKQSFMQIATEMLKAQGKTCVICDHPEKEAIELLKKNGASYMFIGRALQRMGAIESNITTGSAQNRVSLHFSTHMDKEGVK